MQQVNKIKAVKLIAKLVILAVFVLVVISVVKSGYFYTYDRDEITHIQKVYLILSGYKSYQSFYSSFTPIFHIFLLPIFSIIGFSFKAINAARIIMICLFALRIFLMSFIIGKIFNRKVALLFIPLYLFDPFTVFVSMQVRPDNLMITVFTVALTIFIYAVAKSSRLLLFLSGVFFALACLIIFKIVLAVAIIYICSFVFFWKKHKIYLFWFLCFGFVSSITLYFLYFLINGSLMQMLKQVFILAPLFASSARYYTMFGFFHQPNNAYIYGFMGRPLTWMYSWILPLIAAAGAYSTFLKLNRMEEKKSLMKIILLLTLIGSFFTLLLLEQVFIQYYLPVQWLLALFAAVFIEELGWRIAMSNFYKTFIFLFLFTAFILLSKSSIVANTIRATFDSSSNDFVGKTQRLWSIIPNNARTFPNILFRPLGYPLGFGYDEYLVTFPAEVKALLPNYAQTLEKNKVEYIIVEKPDDFYTREAGLESFVKKNYKIVNHELGIWQRVRGSANH